MIFRKLHLDDTQFIIELLNDPLWLQYIGDRGIYSEADARRYIEQSLQHFDTHKYGLWAVQPHFGEPLGLCGLINRGVFSCPDLGFAFLPKARGKGIAAKAVSEVIRRARDQFHFPYLTAVCDPDNQRSITLLRNNGFNRYGRYFFPKSQQSTCFYWLNLI
nr:GNAT family N-acetyltransferase [Alteromonas ponticola]